MKDFENDPYAQLQRLYDAARLLGSDQDKTRAETRFDEAMRKAGDFLRRNRGATE